MGKIVSISGDAPESGEFEVLVDVQREHPEHVSLNVDSNSGSGWALLEPDDADELADALKSRAYFARQAGEALDEVLGKEAEKPEEFARLCANCGWDASYQPSEVTACPACGTELPPWPDDCREQKVRGEGEPPALDQGWVFRVEPRGEEFCWVVYRDAVPVMSSREKFANNLEAIKAATEEAEHLRNVELIA